MLLRRTLEHSRIVKNAVIYLVSFVHEEEKKELASLKDRGITVQTPENRGILKRC